MSPITRLIVNETTMESADRLPDSDFAGPFGDRDQHDVQDADSADEQRDRGDGRGEHGEDVEDLVEGVSWLRRDWTSKSLFAVSLIRCRSLRMRITWSSAAGTVAAWVACTMI